MSADPRMRLRAFLAFLDDRLPEFGKRGACAEKAPNRSPWEPMFEADPPMRPDLAYTWGPGTIEAMSTCAECPVRLECLTWAFQVEQRVSRDWWSGELVAEGRRYGILGGVPGRIREHVVDAEDPVAAADAWFTAYAASQGWNIMDRDEPREGVA